MSDQANAAGMKEKAAAAALSHVERGMRLGLGTGSTAEAFVRPARRAGRRGADGGRCPHVRADRGPGRSLHIPLTTLDETPELDLTIDGADELDDRLRLVKGGGGALLREKIVAAASKDMIVIADASKRVATLGASRCPSRSSPSVWAPPSTRLPPAAGPSALTGRSR